LIDLVVWNQRKATSSQIWPYQILLFPAGGYTQRLYAPGLPVGVCQCVRGSRRNAGPWLHGGCAAISWPY